MSLQRSEGDQSERDLFFAFMEALANPAFQSYFANGNINILKQDFRRAIQDFSRALDSLGDTSNRTAVIRQWKVGALIRRAQCFMALSQLDSCLHDSTEALDLSKEMEFQSGVCDALQLKLITLEQLGDIRGAFLLAVSLKTVDFKKARTHVARLREKLTRICREEETIIEELRSDLMSTGIDLFAKECYKEATEYFIEVVRIVCEFQFVPGAYLYHAQCQLELGNYQECMESCMAVLKVEPANEEGKSILEIVNAVMNKKNDNIKATRKNSRRRKPSTIIPQQPSIPEKKPAMNKKQRKYEEHRRRKEMEKIRLEIEGKNAVELGKKERQIEFETSKMDQSKTLPTYDVKAALDASRSGRKPTDKQTSTEDFGGARPKQIKTNNRAKAASDKKVVKKEHENATNNKSSCVKSKKGSSTPSSVPSLSMLGQSERFFRREDNVHDPPVSARGFTAYVETSNQANASIASRDGLISPLIQSSSQLTRKSLQNFDRSQGIQRFGFHDANESGQSTTPPTSVLSRPSLTRTSFLSFTTPSQRKDDDHIYSRFSNSDSSVKESQKELPEKDTSKFSQQWRTFASCHREDPSIWVTSGPSTTRNVLLNQGCATSKLPVPSFQGYAQCVSSKRGADDANKTVSQWKTLERISSLKLDLGVPTEGPGRSQSTTREYERTEACSFENWCSRDSSQKMPKGFVALCKHFLQDRKTPFQSPYVCSNCSRHRKTEYGIWRNMKNEWQLMRPYPVNVKSEVPFQICLHYANGRNCQQSCTFAHGEEELSFWTMQRQKDTNNTRFTEHEDFDPDRKPQQRIRGSLKIYDERQMEPRHPPAGVHPKNFQLCRWWKSGWLCRTGRQCTFAHGYGELMSWRDWCANEQQKSTQAVTSNEDLSCQSSEKITYRNDMVYSLPGVEVSSDNPSTREISHYGNEERHVCTWVFTVTFELTEVRVLKKIDLLHKYHDCYRLTKVQGFLGEKEVFSKKPTDRWSCSLPSRFDVEKGKMRVHVFVSFETEKSDQTFTQCLKFNFGEKHHLLQGLNVDIASEEALDKISATREKLKLEPWVWTQASMNIVSPVAATSSYQDKKLQERYSLPTRVENVVSAQVMEVNITPENYRRVMHQLLFTEELFMQKAISRFVAQSVSLCGHKCIERENGGMVFAGEGELFGVFKFLEDATLQLDEAAGRLLVRNVQIAWLKVAGATTQDVYEASVEEVTSWGVVLKLSQQICSHLQLTDKDNVSVDLQFQLNRQPLCEWHFAIDRLGDNHLNFLFPEQIELEARIEETPWNYLHLGKANAEQAEVIKRIVTRGNNCQPLVVFGPFGTGKTFTLHLAIRQLISLRNSRILLCTHTNSAADLHVELLHNYLTKGKGLKAATPLRIYQPWRRLETDSKIAKQYALVENSTYVIPKREDVKKHRVVITTLATSQHLLQLQLNHGFFTHVLIDEAAQALEPETLTPLVLAGPNTNVVFTGDHMQMKPEVYSHFARDWGLQRSLPERLFDHYYQKKTEMDCNVIFLTKNYRCHPEILRFPSDNFYGGGTEKGEGLIACSKEAAHPRLGPLLFFAAYGVEEARENSYINQMEAAEVVKRVKVLSGDWPVDWGEKDLSKIGVITAYMTQVRAIRTLLRKESQELSNVTVESIYNVQGKEFRAVFISTVRTSLTCQKLRTYARVGGSGAEQVPYWEFLSDSTLLNTAITRAKSLVAVIGDPVSLCTVGDCRDIWGDYIRRCYDLEALYGIPYAELNQQISAYLSRVALNPSAPDFVPKSATVSNVETDSDCNNQKAKGRENAIKFELKIGEEKKDKQQFPAQDQHNHSPELKITEQNMNDARSTADEDKQEEDSKLVYSFTNETTSQDVSTDEIRNTSQSSQMEEENEQCTLLDEFRRENLEDETVLPRFYDNIIAALLENCKKDRKDDARLQELSQNFPSLQEAKVSQTKSKTERISKHRARQLSSSLQLASGDYKICTINGRHKVHLTNLGFCSTQSSRKKQLVTSSLQPNFLEPEMLRRVMLDNPENYLPCTLRLNSESISAAYAVVSDTKTPDIKIKGRIRGVFDMDRVVIEKTGYQLSSTPDILHSQGKIVGVLNHIIDPHERQFVCRVDYENPQLMRPINKSLPRIVPLTAKNECMPIYKEIRDGDETKVKVDEIDLKEFRSGKFFFLVQYLQWRSDCSTPIGIIIRKLPQENTLDASMKVLFAEHGIRKSFDTDSKKQVAVEFPSSWSIPPDEYKKRIKIEGAFTIDPDNSKDLDDALTLKQLSEKTYRIGVHIADVTYFVKAGTPLDKEALFRCTSYYPGQGHESVPMLPPVLSENLCSLLPDKDSLSLSVFFQLTEEGQLVGKPEIERTIVRSCCKLSYSNTQSIIDGQQSVQHGVSEETTKKIQCLSFLAQKRRLTRLRDGAFDHWSNSDHESTNFKAHEMVEELMLLANEEVAKFLSEMVPDVAPLRTQLPPKDHRLDEWVTQYGQYIKYSLFLRGFYQEKTLDKMSKGAMHQNCAEFKVQESVWSQICDAAKSKDQEQLQYLICNESHHPQMAVVNSHFQRIQPKAQYVCKREEDDASITHFSLGMRCYTHFTSPIRRYVDIQVHRLVLNIIYQGRTTYEPSKEEIAKACRRSTFAHDNSRKFEKGCRKVHLASKLTKRSHEAKAVIAALDNQTMQLEILDHGYNHLSTRQRKINFSKLNPFTLHFDKDRLSITLKWRPRMYIAPTSDVLVETSDEKQEVEKLLCHKEGETDEVLSLPGNNWQEIQKAVREEDYEKLRAVVAKTDKIYQLAKLRNGFDSTRNHQKALSRERFNDETESGHFYKKTMYLSRFDVVKVQLTAHSIQGILHPEIQLFKINPRVHICIEHRKYPRDCFASTTNYQASKDRYHSLDHYIKAWTPVLAMEAASVAIDESDEFTIHFLNVQWTKTHSENVEGSFCILEDYCTSRQIEFFVGDFACVRVREGDFMADTQLGHQFICGKLEEELSSPSSSRSSGSDSENFWVGHCIVKRVQTSNDSKNVEVTMDLHQSSSEVPVELLIGSSYPSVLTLIHRSLTHRRMFSALCNGLQRSSPLVHAICLGRDPGQDDFAVAPSPDYSIVKEHPHCGLKPLNKYQEAAVREALVKPLTLVQGPPGTGKTVTGVHMAYWFTKRNMQLLPEKDLSSHDVETVSPETPPQVIYCGPSNKSVDVVACKMLKIPDLKIIRVYSDRREEADFPTPNRLKPLKNPTDDEDQRHILTQDLKKISLHHVIRREECPFASEIREYDLSFAADKKSGVRTKDADVKKYLELIGTAKEWVLKSSGVQIIMCTCAVAGSPRIVSRKNIQQCIVDECGMCLEPESLVPIIFSRARQVVLIGDHKQLQPVIKDDMAKKLGLNVSLFERHSKRAIMLELQYRMHENICRFPSRYFYEGKLKTDPTVPKRDPRLQSFWPTKQFPIAFCHVEGEEVSSAIKTSHSNEQSKANIKEVRKVVDVVRCLVKKNVHPENVVILSPYREQRKEISDALKNDKCTKNMLVTTVTKSQGSEWDYVIISLVRSLKEKDIEPDPSLSWLREHLGFLTDEHQMNVGITRARRGLCIIGNKHLLRKNTMWQSLIEFYQENDCLVNEADWPGRTTTYNNNNIY